MSNIYDIYKDIKFQLQTKLFVSSMTEKVFKIYFWAGAKPVLKIYTKERGDE